MQCRIKNWNPNRLGNACSSISRGTSRPPSVQIPKSTTTKFGCADSRRTSRPGGIAVAECRLNSRVRVRSTIAFAARATSSVNSRVKKIGVSEIRKSAGHFSVSFTQRKRAAYFSGVKSALNRERSSGSISGRDGSPSRPTYFSRADAVRASKNNSSDAPLRSVQAPVRPTLHQEFAGAHHRLAIEPDVEVAPDAIDMRFGNPLCAGVLGVRVTECNVDAGNFFILQDVADDVGAGGVRANGEFADAIAVFVRACVSAKIFEQLFMIAAKIDNTVVFDLNRERRVMQIAVFVAEIIANHAIHHKCTVRVHRRGEDFATGKIPPFFRRDDPARL